MTDRVTDRGRMTSPRGAVTPSDTYPPEFVITLIHGTNARGAPWTRRETSSLCKYLDEEFGVGRFEVKHFDWDAPNRHAARDKASQELRDAYHSVDGPFKPKDAPQFVIAHSHGGSVVAYALRDDLDFARGLAGAAFLSTPFIQARERLAAWWVVTMVPWLVMMLMATVGVLGWVVARTELWGNTEIGWLEVGLLIGMSLGAGLLGFSLSSSAIGSVEEGLPGRLGRLVKEAVSELDLTRLEGMSLREKVLILRTNGDEASSGLAAAHIISRLLGEIPARIARLPRGGIQAGANKIRELTDWLGGRATVPRTLVRVLLALFLCVWGLLVPAVLAVKGWAWWVQQDFESQWPILSGVDKARGVFISWVVRAGMGMMWTLLAIAAISVSLAILAVPMVTALLGFVYGRWFLLAALFIELSVETTPPGQWLVTQLSLQDKTSMDYRTAFGLAHSMSYDDPRAHKAIAEWIRERLAVVPSAPGAASV